ncbi:MAG: insulinase family protein [Enterocloster sp.]
MEDKRNLEQVKQLAAYRMVSESRVKEMQSDAMVLEHAKSGARIFLMSNEDDNKVFSIGFRTPPADSTGLPHILEHSVLEGSEKFPVKDPFVELVKGSLNTFLNAMTYPDKTVYPVASCNDKDFRNLMDVYLDGVFHPAIYREPKIFQQEGWHYELNSPEDELTINGVVYNEMKGAFSSPESVLDRCTRAVLFPNTPYSNESGGDPARIPELTYEQFTAFHRQYYHPANSYIYLYGDMDMAETLTWLDEQYLSAYDKADFTEDSSIAMEKPFDAPVEREITYSVTEEEGTEDKTYLSLSTVVGTDLDPKLYVAFQILEYTLIDAPGAPLKQALIDAGIGQDILGGYDNGILQPYFSVIAKNAGKEQKGEFMAAVKGTLRRLADQGIDQRSLLAGLNYYEFRYREADYGSAPKGLMYGLWSMDSWLYDGDPLLHLKYQDTFDFLKKAVKEGYFEQLIRDYLLDNPHEALIIVSPSVNQTAREDEALAKRLQAYKETLSAEERKALADRTEELRAYQEEPSSQEDLEKIPMLQREDISRRGSGFSYTVKEEEGVKVVHSCLFTSGIGYLKLLFDTSRIPNEDLPYVGLLKSVLGYVDTEHYSYGDLTSEIYLNSGGIDFSVASYPELSCPGQFKGFFVAGAKVLYEKLDFAFSMIAEILTRSDLDNEKRLGEILDEARSRARMKLENGFHGAAVGRAASYFSPAASFNDRTGGVGYYQFLEEVCRRFSEEPGYRKVLADKLKQIISSLFAADNVLAGYTADEKGYKLLPAALKNFRSALPAGGGCRYDFRFEGEKRNEGFKTSSQVNYVARCGSFDRNAYTGALKVLKVIMNYEYLWMNLRVKGGAYGCMSSFSRYGEGYLVSYRDPGLAATNRIYEGIPEYLRSFTIDERDMTKYVIGTISDVDTPLTPSLKGNRNLSAYLSGVTDEMVQKEREEILDVTQEDIRALAGILESLLNTQALCAIGNDEQIRSEAAMFKEVKNLYH